MQFVHGGDWAGYRAEFGRDPLDFSANVSPLGLPGGVAKAITAALATYIIWLARRISSGSMGRSGSPMVGLA